jgi:hypothetical protein
MEGFLKLFESYFWCVWGICYIDDKVVLIFLSFACAGNILFYVLVFSVEECFDFDFWFFENGILPIDVWFEILASWVPKDKAIFP